MKRKKEWNAKQKSNKKKQKEKTIDYFVWEEKMNSSNKWSLQMKERKKERKKEREEKTKEKRRMKKNKRKFFFWISR